MKNSEKIIIYQVFPRWFGNQQAGCVKNGSLNENGTGKFSDFTPTALHAIKELGTTYIWYTGIIEHATQTDYSQYGINKDHSAIVKGKAGSPYAIKDYYDVDPDLAQDVPGRMAEFEALIERSHVAGLKVIIDFVPNHVARQYASDTKPIYVSDLGQDDNTSKAFDPDNNFYYLPGQSLSLYFKPIEEVCEYTEFPAKATGNDRFTDAPDKTDWYETIKLNYGIDYVNGHACHFDPVPDTWKKMRDILLFWAAKGVDGFRCDMAEMVPVQFWNWVIPQIKRVHDVIFIAEIYNPNEYRNYIHTGKFDYLYDKVGLYDTLRGVICGTLPAHDLTHCWQSVEGIQHNMLNFLENHDEQRIASDFFAGDARKGIAGMIVATTMNSNPVMIYSGQELGEPGMDNEGFSGCDGRTTIFDYWSVKTIRNWVNGGKFDNEKLSAEQIALRSQYATLLNLIKKEPVIRKGSFYDLMYANPSNQYFNSRTQYTFLRKYKNEVLLVVANFGPSVQKARINIPADAFHALGFEDNKPAMVTDLLTGQTGMGTLTEVWPYQLNLPAHGGRILKFTYIEA